MCSLYSGILNHKFWKLGILSWNTGQIECAHGDMILFSRDGKTMSQKSPLCKVHRSCITCNIVRSKNARRQHYRPQQFRHSIHVFHAIIFAKVISPFFQQFERFVCTASSRISEVASKTTYRFQKLQFRYPPGSRSNPLLVQYIVTSISKAE